MYRTRWIRAACFVGAGALWGCTSAEQTNALPKPFTDGARLQAQFFAIDDVRVLRHWQDTERNEACELAVVPEPGGATHCLPLNRITFHQRSHTLFSDAACAMPLFDEDAGVAGETVVVETPSNTCNAAPRVFLLGDASLQLETYQQTPAGDCVSALSTKPLRALGSLLPLDVFASAAPTVGEVGDGIGVTTLVAEGGATEVIAAYDLARGHAVDAREEADGHVRWTPTHLAFGIDSQPHGNFGAGFSDSACTVRVGTMIAHSAMCPVAAVLSVGPESESCGSSSQHFHEAGAMVAGPDLHDVDELTGECRPAPSFDDTTLFFEVGQDLSLIDAGTSRVGEARVQQPWATTATGRLVMPQRARPLFDGAWHTDCEIVRADDGVFRCLPAHSVTTFFVDADCTRRVYREQRSAAACIGWPVIPRVVREHATAYEVGAEISPSLLFSDEDGTCIEVAPPARNMARFFLVEAIDPSAFATAIEATHQSLQL